MTLTRTLPLFLVIGALALLIYKILGTLIEPIVWSVILSFGTWPIYRKILSATNGRPNLASGVMVFLVGCVVILPLVGISSVIHREGAEMLRLIPGLIEHPPSLSKALPQVPWVGKELAALSEHLDTGDELLKNHLAPQVKELLNRLMTMLGSIGLLMGQVGFILFLMFFQYRDGVEMLEEVKQGLHKTLGGVSNHYFAIAERTARAVLYGIVLTAMVQGSVAGIGYWGAGLKEPLLLTLATILMAMIPFGAVTIWIPSALWLLSQGETLQCLGLLAWGFFIVSWVDNLVRPFFISHASHISFALIVLGLVGGLISFGFIGLFIGPVILAIAHAVWREWLRESHPIITPPQ
jgi:predicted PurR-regulated permease PerM